MFYWRPPIRQREYTDERYSLFESCTPPLQEETESQRYDQVSKSNAAHGIINEILVVVELLVSKCVIGRHGLPGMR